MEEHTSEVSRTALNMGTEHTPGLMEPFIKAISKTIEKMDMACIISVTEIATKEAFKMEDLMEMAHTLGLREQFSLGNTYKMLVRVMARLFMRTARLLKDSGRMVSLWSTQPLLHRLLRLRRRSVQLPQLPSLQRPTLPLQLPLRPLPLPLLRNEVNASVVASEGKGKGVRDDKEGLKGKGDKGKEIITSNAAINVTIEQLFY